jgi:hypothetical protein
VCINGLRGADRIFQAESSRFQHAPRRHVLAAHPVAIPALAFKEQYLDATASQSGGDRRACDTRTDDNYIGAFPSR